MANRRSPSSKPYSTPTSRRPSHSRHKYQLRNSPLSRKLVQVKPVQDSHAVTLDATSISTPSRPVLVPLQPNLRRLPSRLMTYPRDLARNYSGSVRDFSEVQTGAKRKRAVSGNENVYVAGRSAREGSKFKRQRSSGHVDDMSDDDASSAAEMDIDENSEVNWGVSQESDTEEETQLGDSDDFLINEAPPRQLQRLRKDKLIRLYTLAGLSDSTEDLTKSDLIDALISAREDGGDIPPSSPPGRTDAHSSGCSSDEGNDGGGEETDAGRNSHLFLRRRVTVQDMSRAPTRTLKTRSLSLSNANPSGSNGMTNGKPGARVGGDRRSPVHNLNANSVARRRTAHGFSARSSPTNSSCSTALPSPPVTRLRSRTLSTESNGLSVAPSTSTSGTSSRGSSVSNESTRRTKGKGKHVDFSEPVHEFPVADESDLTDLPDSCDGLDRNPSPRRLRSKGKDPSSSRVCWSEASHSNRRMTPKRRAKGKVGCLKEDESEEDPEEEDVDQLASSPSPSPEPETPTKTPRPDQRTPLKRRLRSRNVDSHKPPSDGDDEEEANEDIEDDAGDNAIESDQDNAADEDYLEAEEVVPIMTIPRKLRNGKIVGDEDVEVVEEGEDEELATEGVSDDEETIQVEAQGSDSEVDVEEDADEAENADEPMENDIDLDNATQKTLFRLRRDDLVRLCSSRDLDVEGTKAQMVQALLDWRDSQSISSSAPSSSSTARPPSVSRPVARANGQGRKKKTAGSPPVLLRSQHIHIDEPCTPRVSERKEAEGELELDLESLGLEDKEIPPEKLTKLEKIGSGGFKDVFIGKFKGRRVAIAEFRDQLSAMDIKELKLLAEFAHPNIVRFLGVSIPENTRETPVMIISELCANGDLFDYVRNVPAPSLYKVLSIMLDIAKGLQYLHERKPSVIHRDCKSSNILITSKSTAKIADFGLAKVKQSTRSMVRSLVGTVNWQAPELWHAHPKYNHKVDVFSCACVYWEMLQWHNPNKKFPWEGMNEHAIYEAVGAKKQRPSLSGLRKQWCPEIVDLIEKMWAQDHQDRPDIAEVVETLQTIIRAYR